MNQDEAKRLAAKAAIAEVSALVEDGSDAIVGLGSGSTAKLFIEEVGLLVRAGMNVTGVPTSEASRAQAESLGIPLLDDDGPWLIDLTVDGADEVSEALDLIKGGGGAHTREKIVNYASARNVIVVDGSKLSKKLGDKWPVPLEVLPFAFGSTMSALGFVGRPTQRLRKDGSGKPWFTDAGNPIVDLHVGTIDDPLALDRRLRSIPGIVETGLFVQRADIVIVADETGVRQLRRSDLSR